MPIVKIDPSKDHPAPFSLEEQTTDTLLDEMAVAGNTAELQHALGAQFDLDEIGVERERELLEAVVKKQEAGNLQRPNTAFAAAAFLKTYGAQLALDAAQARAAITNKLMEIANCGDPRYELKALELLGKHVDIGLFTERSEVTINYKDPNDLEREIRERVKRLLNADVIDVNPITQNLDEELGVLDVKTPPMPLELPEIPSVDQENP